MSTDQKAHVVQSHAHQPGVASIPQIKNIIAVASGKGGVGKSTTAVNLALALSLEGARVGLLDADIYGPNVPAMLGASEIRPEVTSEKKMRPVYTYGLQTMSIAYLVDPQQAMIWRGPMVSSALQQLLHDTLWDDLDYLLIDLPPGTGDVQLTMAQKIPVTGAVVVTTPQDIALLDVKKAIHMFQKVKIELLGIIENMSTHICSQCGHHDAIFGRAGGDKLAKAYHTCVLGRLPLDAHICAQMDYGQPVVVASPQSDVTQLYRNISRELISRISKLKLNHRAKFPKIESA